MITKCSLQPVIVAYCRPIAEWITSQVHGVSIGVQPKERSPDGGRCQDLPYSRARSRVEWWLIPYPLRVELDGLATHLAPQSQK